MRYLAARQRMRRRQFLGRRFGRHKLTKADLQREIAAIPAGIPITLLPPRARPGAAKAQYEISAFLERCREGDLRHLIGLFATELATQFRSTWPDRTA
jgi:hypothetical protein